MASIYDVPPNDLIEKAAVELAKLPEIAPPEWAKYVKTGHFHKRPPVREDWWYVRAAAILRAIYSKGPVGVQKLRTKYGGRKRRGHPTEHVYKGSGNLIRKILQQLEHAKLIQQGAVGVHKGRVITPKGRSFMDKLAKEVLGPKVEKQVRILKKRKPLVKKEKPVEAPEGAAPGAPEGEEKPERKPRQRKHVEEAQPEAGAEEAKEASEAQPEEAEQPGEEQ